MISRSVPAPQSVCWAHDDGNEDARLYLPDQCYDVLRSLLKRGDQWVNHDICFDAAIACVESPDLLPFVFDGFDSGQIRCTQIREQLIRISRGEGRFVVVADDEEANEDAKMTRTRFDLASTSWRWLKHFVKKKDTWRLRYAELYGVPLDQWPQEARDYPLEDATVTRRVYLAQQKYIDETHGGSLPDEIPQHSYAWALKLVQLWGVRTDGEAVERLKKTLTTRQTDAIMSLLPKGIFRIGGTKKAPKYVKTISVIREKVSAAYLAQGEPVPETKKGAVSTATKTLRESGDADLRELADALGAMKLLSSFIPVLESGTQEPICADYNVLVESGRTSCRKPNMQQLPRGAVDKKTGEKYEPRLSFIAREGKGWVSVDYEMAELVGQGQMCIDLVGFSVMAEELNAGRKPVMAFAAQLAGCSYETGLEAYKDKNHPLHATIKSCRHRAKGVVYGAAGFMQPRRLYHLMLDEGIDATLSDAKTMLSFWERSYSEFPHFFRYVKSQIGYEFKDEGTITQLRSGRIRGGVDLPAACNTFFQGLVADAAKTALRDVVRECYMVPSSSLFGSRVVVFAHDEIIIECDEGKVHDVGYRLAEVMKAAAKKFMPDVKMGAEPAAMVRWVKDCQPTFREERLVVTR